MTTKKILLVVPSFGIGGTIAVLNGMCRSFQGKADITIYAVSPYGPERTMFDDYKQVRFAAFESLNTDFDELKGLPKLKAMAMRAANKTLNKIGINLYDRLARSVTRTIADMGFDAVAVLQEGPSTALISLTEGVRKVAWVLSNYENYLELHKGANETAIYARYDTIVCCSEYTKGTFLKYMSNVADKVKCIYLAQDLDKINEGANDKTDIDFDHNLFNIISLGRLDPVKRFAEIPRIAALMRMAGCRFRWIIVGDGSEATAITNNIKKYKVEECVKAIGRRTNPYPYIAASDLFVSMSVSEAYPMVVNEAKILHIPVVATDYGAAFEVVRDGEGYICKFDQLADTLTSVITNKDKYNYIKQGVSSFVFDNSAIASQSLDAILGNDK